MKSSTYFERRIERVFTAVVDEGATVTWNAHEADPDTGEPRQIDILIENPDGLRTHVECRDRKRVEGVQWIEELAGRRLSLNADKIIAVPSSGFNKNATQKAKRMGVTLFKLSALSGASLSFALRPPKIYLREVMSANFHFDISSPELTKNEIKTVLQSGFPMPFQAIMRTIAERGQDKSGAHVLDRVDSVDFSDQWNLEVEFYQFAAAVEGSIESKWSSMTLTPYHFQKPKPNETTVLAQISDGLLPGVRAELIISKRKILFQVDFEADKLDLECDKGWSNRTYCNQAIIESELVLGKEMIVKSRGQSQAQFQFDYSVV